MRGIWMSTLALLGACGPSNPAADPAVFSEPDPVEIDGSHYTTELERGRVRVLRARFPPGHRSPQHRHSEYCAVFLTPASWRFTGPDGDVTEAESSAGDIACGPAEIHSPENVGPEPVELILIEWKDGAP